MYRLHTLYWRAASFVGSPDHKLAVKYIKVDVVKSFAGFSPTKHSWYPLVDHTLVS